MCSSGLTDDQILFLLDDSELSGVSSDEDEKFAPSPTNAKQIDSENEDDSISDETCGVQNTSDCCKRESRPFLYREMDFTEKCHPPQIDHIPVENPSPIQSPAQYFSEYFSECFFDNAAKFTNMYSVAKVASH
ncbi:uncharacterized protein LOC126253068 [Schistocerca nitens]|uniref:uncharacterized protein LOC126253068 n=1 Tax=Schistocerca nitens TaxID=7011 RepID=UPI002117D5E3|nr:uncharacterized protein LOC126253068 [Schistocerca nitens]